MTCWWGVLRWPFSPAILPDQKVSGGLWEGLEEAKTAARRLLSYNPCFAKKPVCLGRKKNPGVTHRRIPFAASRSWPLVDFRDLKALCDTLVVARCEWPPLSALGIFPSPPALNR
jgi:hypothetical protein